ncbi:hypothetical protein [Flavobacterium sp.]|uniref:hypothetical protein n=1 Tax=Flavobacterium sp. TaxID=239 RepID=UPI00260D297E|nr:hypothetical protein [Flavobacterium sp.]
MAQHICYLITTEDFDAAIPIDIVHFHEKNATIIPLLMEVYEFETMVSCASEANNVADFHQSTSAFTFEYPTRKALEFVAKADLKTFGIVYFSDDFMVPEDSSPIFFIENIRRNLAWNDYISAIHDQLNSAFKSYELLKNEDKYWDFYNAEEQYFRLLEKNLR